MSLSISESTIPASFHAVLNLSTVATLATTGPNGEPQASPVWFDWDGAVLRFAVLPETQKLKNMRRDPRIALTIVDPADNGRYLEVRGTITLALDDGDRFGDLLARKYLQRDHLPWAEPGDERWVATVTPRRVITQDR